MDTSNLEGSVSKLVTVTSNDSGNPKIELTLRADVLTSVSVLPQDNIYMRSRGGQPWEGRALIRKDSTETGRLEVSDIRTSADWMVVKATLLDTPTPRRPGVPVGVPGDYLLEIRFRDGTPVFGKRRETLTFATGLPREPRATLVVFADIQAPVNLSTERLTLSRRTDGRAAGTLVISVRKGLDPSRLVTEADPPGLDVRLEPTGKRMFRVQIVSQSIAAGKGRVDFRVGKEYARLAVDWSGSMAP
jgi:hypothetical protein